MTISATYRLNNDALEAMDLTLAITMPVHQWRRILDALEVTGARSSAEFNFRGIVKDALSKVAMVSGEDWEVTP